MAFVTLTHLQPDVLERDVVLLEEGEHGPHGILRGPDGRLTIVAGNYTKREHDSSVVPEHWDEDHLLPRLWDANGHASGRKAPGGWIARVDLDGDHWETYAIGFRNPYDIAYDDGDAESAVATALIRARAS